MASREKSGKRDSTSRLSLQKGYDCTVDQQSLGSDEDEQRRRKLHGVKLITSQDLRALEIEPCGKIIRHKNTLG